jgi:hypothetical protein
VDTIFKVILWILAAIFAWAAVEALRRTRNWSPVATIGVYLALFGGATFGLLQIQSYYSRKLTDFDSFPSENDLFAGGLVILAVVIVLALDLLGKVDIMGQIQRAVSGGGTSTAGKGPNSGPPAGGMGHGPAPAPARSSSAGISTEPG